MTPMKKKPVARQLQRVRKICLALPGHGEIDQNRYETCGRCDDPMTACGRQNASEPCGVEYRKVEHAAHRTPFQTLSRHAESFPCGIVRVKSRIYFAKTKPRQTHARRGFLFVRACEALYLRQIAPRAKAIAPAMASDWALGR